MPPLPRAPRLIVALLALLPTAPAQSPPDTSRTHDVAIQDHAAMSRELAELARTSNGTAAIVPLGTSRAGRSIEALRIARGANTPGRPGILVVAGLDAEMAWTSGLVMDHARSLLASEPDSALRALLERATLYLVPRANPDGVEQRTSRPLSDSPATGVDFDNDRDGRSGEDPLADVDGDGVIGWMRVLDPKGEWTLDPTEPRALVRADAAKGQRGRWRLVRESLDADGDGEVGEDPPLDGVVNQNFPQGWAEHAPTAGRFATEEPEAWALAEFVVTHRDIALVVTYGMLDDLAEKPKVKDDGGRRSASPSSGIPATDADLYVELGRRWKALGGTSGKSDASDAGTFQAWVQSQRGIWTVNLMPWSVPLDEKAANADEHDAKSSESKDGAADKPAPSTGSKLSGEEAKPSDDAKRLRWFDAHPEAIGFRAWTPFHHPDLGDVEIGGLLPFAMFEPPPETRAAIAGRTLAFLASLGDALPRARIARARAHDLGAGTWRIEAVLENESLLALRSASARRAETIRPARVRLEVKSSAAIVAGPREELVSDLAGSGGQREFAWIVRAQSIADVSITVETDSAGSDSVTPEVQR